MARWAMESGVPWAATSTPAGPARRPVAASRAIPEVRRA